ncbi:MAG: uracil-DNA glycosylase [Nitrospinota bacterium]|nr:uracil-DNA glycosylase [Nitrospinota bacterium]
MTPKKKLTDSFINYLEDLKSFNVNFIALNKEQVSVKTKIPEKKEAKLIKTSNLKTPSLPYNQNVKMKLVELSKAIENCMRCKLGNTRNNLVFGCGSENAKLVIIGEAPGAEEDRQGIPFVGRAGQMLTKMIENVIEVPRQEVFICNILKCRPPQNRNPEEDEIACCEPYLKKQLETINPKLILTLGKFASQWLLQSETPISKLRGKFSSYHGIPCLPTFHPAYLLRNPKQKKFVHEDLLKVKDVYHGNIVPEIELDS